MAAFPGGCPLSLDELLAAADRRMYDQKRLAHSRGGEILAAGGADTPATDNNPTWRR